jgi:Putative methyltransferase
VTSPDWLSWHDQYEEAGSSLNRRLLRVQHRVVEALASQPTGPIRVLSVCAGQGRDLLEPLAAHPRHGDVRALLVERDPRNAAVAARIAREAGLDAVEVLIGDASRTGTYAAIVPVDVALVCGVFGNVPDGHIRRTIRALPRLLREGGTVIWTRHRQEPDLTPRIRGWFADEGFEESGFDTEPGFRYGVGTHLLTRPGLPYHPDVTMFSFNGDGAQAVL